VTTFSFKKALNDSKGALDLIPDGEYDARVIAAEAAMSQNSKPMIKVQYEITAGASAKRRLRTQYTISDDNPTALAIFFKQMEALGLGADFFEVEPAMTQVAGALLNRPARIVVGHKEWNKIDRNEIKGTLPPMFEDGPIAPGAAPALAKVSPPKSGPPTPSDAPPLPI
jgi:hypothetical protein